MRRRAFRLAGTAALAAMLFLQAAFALAACGLDRPQAAQALSMLAEQTGGPPCHEPEQNAALCLAHCQSGDQTLDKQPLKVPPLVAPAAVPGVQVAPQDRAAASARLPVPLAGPPRHILFQSLLI
jgi:hypothetical protein